MILQRLELHGIIKWHDYISFCQQGQTDQLPSFKGITWLYPSVIHGKQLKKSTMNQLTENVSHWCLHMAITSHVPRGIILISEITLSKKCIFIALHLIFKSKRGVQEIRVMERRSGDGEAQSSFILPLM